MTIADIDKETAARLYGAARVATVEDARMSSGAPLFIEADVHKTQHCLDIILRKLFVEKRISREYFNAKCREHAIEAGFLPSQANTVGSNLVRTLVGGNITIARFLEALQMLDLTLTDMTVSVRSSKGSSEMFGIQEIEPKG